MRPLARSSVLSRALLLAALLFASCVALAGGQLLARILTPIPGDNEWHRVLLQPDGNRLMIGYAPQVTDKFAVARYTPTGPLDTTFGNNGSAVHAPAPGNAQAWAAALQPDGKIVLAGYSRNGSTRFALMRLNADGSVDNGFASGGAVTAIGAGDAAAYAIALQADGRILAGGYSMLSGRKVFTVARYNADGTLDTTYGGGGFYVRVAGTTDSVIHSLLLLPDGTLLAAGDSSNGTGDIDVVHLNANGGFINTYGSISSPNVVNLAGGWDMAMQPDGKILIVGATQIPATSTFNAFQDLAVVRFNADGTIDTAFGGRGTGIANLFQNTGTTSGNMGYGLALQPDGKIVASGTVMSANGSTGMAAGRLNADGSSDTMWGSSGHLSLSDVGVPSPRTGYGIARRADGGFVVAGGAIPFDRADFDALTVSLDAAGGTDAFNGNHGTAGWALLDLGSIAASAQATALQGDGKLVVAGYAQDPARDSPFVTPFTGVLARYNADGSLDTSFGNNGFANPAWAVYAVALQSDGKIVIGGDKLTDQGGCCGASVAFARYDANGTPDTLFGNAGQMVLTPFGEEYIFAVAIQTDGKIFGAGQHLNGTEFDSLFVRLNANGSPDATFGSAGRLQMDLDPGNSDASRAVAIQADGKVVATSYAALSGVFKAVRFNIDGTLDTGFGSNGVASVAMPETNSVATSLALQADGRIVLGGWGHNGTNLDFQLARLLPNGAPDTSFGSGGTVANDFGGDNVLYGLALTASGKIVGVGQDGPDFAVVQYLANGTPDAGFGSGGNSAIDVNGPNDVAYSVSVAGDGSLYVAGNASGAFGWIRVAGDAGALTLSRTSVDFGGESMGTTSLPRTVTLTNGTNATITVTGITVSDGQFAFTSGCTTLAPGASCSIDVTFKPTPTAGALNSTNPASATLAISTDTAGTFDVALTGTGEKSLVTHYYESILRREPDAPGKSFWQNEAVRMQSLGANIDEVWYAMAIAFYDSAEYAGLNRDNTGFVTDLYATFFNRAPDSAGLSYWVGQLDNGMPRDSVLISFLFSPEFTSFTQGIFGNTSARAEVDVVGDFYRGILGRLPDNAGFTYWVGQFRTAQCSGAQAVQAAADSESSSFLASPEYANRNRTNAQFVADLYDAFLRRGGDSSGVQYWISQLDSGAMTRDQERAQFVSSPEFSNRVSAIVNQGCMQ